jgi:enoyl-CoA hydratase
MGYNTISVTHIDGVDELTLLRADRRSSLTLEMVDELTAYFVGLGHNGEVRVVLMSGAGADFCVGLDLAQASDAPVAGPAFGLTYMRRFGEIITAIARAPQIIIAAVGGAAAGGGLSLALACDMRLAGKDALFATAFIKLGLSGAELGLSYLLPRAVGTSHAADMMITGRRVYADEALRIGLVSRVVDAGSHLQEARDLAAAVAAESAPFGLRLTKDAIQAGLDATGLAQAIDLEAKHQALCFQSGDVEAGRAAFAEKRAPAFVNHPISKPGQYEP